MIHRQSVQSMPMKASCTGEKDDDGPSCGCDTWRICDAYCEHIPQLRYFGS